MEAQALICDEAQRFTLETVELPDPGEGEVRIRARYSGVSVGTEFALIRNKISWGPYPLCTGYMATGTVEATGPGVTEYQPGDPVYYRANRGMRLKSGGAVSCVSGTHCSHAVTAVGGTHGIDHLPAETPPDAASMFVLPAVGLNGVDMAQPRMGDRVVVFGAGLIGLGVVAACVHRGCRVVAADIDPARLELARRFGAAHVVDTRETDLAGWLDSTFGGRADVVFECTGLPDCIDPAITLCREHGCFVWQGNYGSDPVKLHFLTPHALRLRMCFPCDDGGPDCRRAVVRNMALSNLDWGRCISHRLPFREAPALFHELNEGRAREATGIVINWED